MSNARIAYSPRPDATPEGEIASLAGVYAFVLQAHGDKKEAAEGTHPDGRDSAKEIKNGCAATTKSTA